MHFEADYEAFMRLHEAERSGESLRRLQEGHDHAEKLFLEQVWWPAVGHFDYLHPECEVRDFRDGTRFLDFAYIRGPLKACFEIDGYGPHSRDISRWQFADQLIRQNHLVLDGWMVIRFAYDDIREKPRRCQQIVQQLLGRWFGEQGAADLELSFKEKEIIRLAVQCHDSVTPRDVSFRLGISVRYARELLHVLAKRRVLLPASGTERIRSYRLNPHGKRYFL
ncbi:DNA-binding response regulator [Paenibacillus hamazuiensis]|uniref:DNA-binding response regulator n=1 Tax=Paenibacillus hamazuiensis TaxID=2936508 RepID=UPI00200EEAC0|nr:DNA-binding response regulator [Paenibacillus hamazuiensis]